MAVNFDSIEFVGDVAVYECLVENLKKNIFKIWKFQMKFQNYEVTSHC